MTNATNGGPPTRDESRNRAQRVTNWLLALVAVALIALVAVFVLRDDTPSASATTSTTAPAATEESTPVDESTTVPEDGTSTTVAGATTTIPSSTTSVTVEPSEPVPTPDELAAAAAVVDEWITALGTGDADTAWDLIDPASQEAFGGRAAFDGSFSGLVEGFGAWASSVDVLKYTNAVPRTDPATFLITWVGPVSQEGTSAMRAFAIPVTTDSQGTGKVQPFVRSDLVQFVVPEVSDPPAEFASITTFEFDIPTGALPFVFVDGFYEENQEVVDQGDGTSRVYVTPDGNLEVGASHVLGVLYVQPGISHAEAVPFAIGDGS